MMKLTLSLLMLIMSYQGNTGKYYTIQKVSLIISGFFSLFLSGVYKQLAHVENRKEVVIVFLTLWGISFLVHYIWFLNCTKENLVLHYKEYKKNLWIFLGIMFLGILLNI